METIFILLMAVLNTPLTVKSPAFANNGMIPAKYTCSGANINPAISVGDIPTGALSLALIVDDPDAPKGTVDHWVMWNIPISGSISEDSAPGVQGLNTKNENKYMGPCPPSGTHHYHFKVYALDTKLDLPDTTDKAALMKAMDSHILASGELVGLYKK